MQGPPPPLSINQSLDILNELLILTVATVLTNLPFGYWRAGVRKLSPAWFVAVHAAVPVVVVLRLVLGVEWRLATLPVLIVAYFAGQALGGSWRRRRSAASDTAGSGPMA